MVSRRQIKHAIKVLEQACDEDFAEVKQELVQSLQMAQQLITESEKKTHALVYDQGKSQSLFGFTEQFVQDINITHSPAVQQFVTNWCQRQSDWRYPWCWLIANQHDYVHLSVKSHLVYVCINHRTVDDIKSYTKHKVGKTEHANPQMFRTKPLQFTGHIEDHHVPYNQIGTVISLDLVPYFSLEQTQNLVESCAKVLRPGGQALIHFADGDGEQEWQQFVDKKIAYCNEQSIQRFADVCELHTKFYHIEDMYSFVVLTKPGVKTSAKSHLTKITPL